MSEFKGTPGPWEGKDVSICSQHEAGLQLGFLSTGDVSRRAEGLANAYLITAAPELLEALLDMVLRIEYYAGLTDKDKPNIEDWAYTYNSTDMERVRKAINKALGR
jgi:hypothetical protein